MRYCLLTLVNASQHQSTALTEYVPRTPHDLRFGLILSVHPIKLKTRALIPVRVQVKTTGFLPVVFALLPVFYSGIRQVLSLSGFHPVTLYLAAR